MSLEFAVRGSWFLLAALHAPPALALVRPAVLERLYGANPSGTTGVLLSHRGALFAALVLVSLFAAFDPAVRRLATLALAVSMVGFLLVALRAGALTGPLRSIAIADAVGLAPLALVSWSAFRS
ncbi:MAG: hypothetical protein ACRBN8_12185 [Nannocystales bacterium]